MKINNMSFYDKLRYATNVVSLALMNLNVFGFSLRTICAPGFQCHGCPWATFACPVGVISYNLTLRTLPVYAIAMVLAFGFIFARLICSYLCPFGFLQDLMHRIPFPIKLRIPKIARYIKYVILLLFVILLPWFLGYEDVQPLVQISSNLDKCDTPGMIYVNNLKVTNLSEIPVTEFPLTIDFVDSSGAPSSDHPSIYYVMKNVKVAPGETVKIAKFPVPNVTSDGGNIMVTSALNRPVREAPWMMYFCEWCPLGELTAAFPKKVARLCGVENPTNAFFQWDLYSAWTSPVSSDSKTECALPDDNVPLDPSVDDLSDIEGFDPDADAPTDGDVQSDGDDTSTPEADVAVDAAVDAPSDSAEVVSDEVTAEEPLVEESQEDLSAEVPEDEGVSTEDLFPEEDPATDTATASAGEDTQMIVFVANDSDRVASAPMPVKNFWTIRLVVTLLFLIAFIIFSRPFCQTTCPLGAMLGIIGRYSPMSMKVDHSKCVNCGLCDKVCPMDLDVRKEAGSMECIFCGNCSKKCPKKCITRGPTFKK